MHRAFYQEKEGKRLDVNITEWDMFFELRSLKSGNPNVRVTVFEVKYGMAQVIPLDKAMSTSSGIITADWIDDLEMLRFMYETCLKFMEQGAEEVFKALLAEAIPPSYTELVD
jgi:hypothetical protein